MKSRLLLAPLLLFLLHAFFYRSYGIFRDEYYYFACGQHPAWGYVDHPPLVGWISFVLSWLVQKDLSLFRFWSFAAAAAYLALILHWVRLQRGGPWAQTLVAVAIIFSPIRLGLDHFFSMNSLEPLLWLGLFWLFSRICTLKSAGLIGLACLIALSVLNKHTAAVYVVLLSLSFFWDGPQRRLYAQRIVIVAALSLLLISPHILWQIQNGWPTLEFQTNARLYKNAALTVPALLGDLILHHHPLAALLWIPGLWFLISQARWRALRGYAAVFLLFLLTLLLGHGKSYYAAGLMGPLLAVGAIECEARIRRARWILPTLIALTGFALMPLSMPVLPVEFYQSWEKTLGIRPSAGEKHEQGALPQHFADMFGWQELAVEVAGQFQKIPVEDQLKTAIFAQNYGQAGAIDYYGRALGLPPASSGHNTYFLWGLHPRDATQILIIGGKREDHEKYCGQLQLLAEFDHPLRMPYERHLPLYLCRELTVSPSRLWPEMKEYI